MTSLYPCYPLATDDLTGALLALINHVCMDCFETCEGIKLLTIVVQPAIDDIAAIVPLDDSDSLCHL